jgi:hypothetical protein
MNTLTNSQIFDIIKYVYKIYILYFVRFEHTINNERKLRFSETIPLSR